MFPFFIYYSMFGFQRIGDLIWAAADARTRGFVLGGTAGRTTLNGEGLQHQDGHSLLNAIAFPTVRSYDPAYAYETAVIIFDGLRRMYVKNEDVMYYLTLENENYEMPAMPPGAEEGIVRGMYQVATKIAGDGRPHVQLFGSGAILRLVRMAQDLLAEKYGVSSTVWSVTSWTELRRDAHVASRWNLLHPGDPPRQCYYERQIAGLTGPFIAATDYVRAVPEQLDRWTPGGLFVLGTDGLGRSETRAALRRHFEVDAECITLAALTQLAERGQFARAELPKVVADLGIDANKVDPLFA
jgi:pyruvate dehydrogenase E1 component